MLDADEFFEKFFIVLLFLWFSLIFFDFLSFFFFVLFQWMFMIHEALWVRISPVSAIL